MIPNAAKTEWVGGFVFFEALMEKLIIPTFTNWENIVSIGDDHDLWAAGRGNLQI